MNLLLNILKEYSRLLIIFVLGIAIGSSLIIKNVYFKQSKISQPNHQQTEISVTAPKSEQAQAVSSSSKKNSPSVSAPVQTPVENSVPTEPNNSAKCEAIATEEKADLNSLNAQISQQLLIMKTIIGNSSIDNEILQYGGNPNETIKEGQITESFNQANDEANSLIDKLSSDKQNYTDELIGLLNSNSPVCSQVLNSLMH